MKSARIRTVLQQPAAMIAAVETKAKIIIARPTPASPADRVAAPTPAAIRRYWRKRPLPPEVRSSVTHAELIADSRGDV